MSRNWCKWLATVAVAGLGLLLAIPPAPAEPPSELVKKAIKEWQTRPDLKPYADAVDKQIGDTPVAPQQPVVGSDVPPGAKLVSIHLGLNQVSPTAYPGTPDLDACENDAKSMEKLARDGGFTTEIKLSKDATTKWLLDKLDELATDPAKKLKAGDVLLFTYSGHGGDRPDTSANPDEPRDQTLCLYNRQLIDDELAAEWAKFDAGVRIVMIADSCHSGTVLKYTRAARDLPRVEFSARGVDVTPKLTAQARGLAKGEVLKPEEKSVFRTLPPDAQANAEKAQKDDLKKVKDATPKQSASEAATRASVVLLAACQDDQLALEVGDHGLFTAAILNLMGGQSKPASYRKLFDGTIGALRPYPSQRPKLTPLGPDGDKVADLKPFAR